VTGQTLAHYRITSAIGAGGMGEVYRATDTKLGRDVAIKVLPREFAADPERLARFEREARVLASLNHPGIAHLYGFESTALPDGTSAHFLVMELVEGEDLAKRLERGPIPVEDAIPIARQVAEALEEAHEKGIVHRDLKPANVKLTPDGKVKVLDFGLAKAWSGDDPAVLSGTSALSQSPTLAHTGTAAGLILGTAAYMSPEQARAKAVDKRADIWAFGVVLDEMLTGRRLFHGETVSDVLAAVLRQEIDWSVLPANTPGGLRHLLARCLERDPRRRLRDMGEARLALEANAIDGTGEEPAASRGARVGRLLPWAVAAAATAVALVSLPGRGTRTRATAPLRKLAIAVEGLKSGIASPPALSPDGKRIVYVAGNDLWLRELDSLQARVLVAGAAPTFPFWAPDSAQVAYLAGEKLWRVPVAGGEPVFVADAGFHRGGNTPGGAWLADGTIVFAPAANGTGLLSVPARGGQFTALVERDASESDFHKPSVLPDGRTVVFVIDRSEGGARAIGAFRDGRRKTLLVDEAHLLDAPVYSPSGHLLYVRRAEGGGASDAVWAVPFSAERLEVTGEAFPVASSGHWPTVSVDGTLLYSELRDTALELVRLDSGGRVVKALGPAQAFCRDPAVSPEGNRLAVAEGSAIVVYDLRRGTRSPLTFDDRLYRSPAWTPDGKSLLHSARRGGFNLEIVKRAADGSGTESVLGPGAYPAVSPDGRFVMFEASNPDTDDDLYYRPLDGSGDRTDFLVAPGHAGDPAFAPDGRHVAYMEERGGRSEVFLRPFPAGEGVWQVSTNGGDLPRFSRSGDRLYYVHANELVEVPFAFEPMVRLGTPRTVVDGEKERLRLENGYDVAPGGGYVAVREVIESKAAAPTLTVVESWFSEFEDEAGGGGKGR
jgi:Tol biopolymer transport system component